NILLFFFQAEDGIRDFHVTGVQTCALPIFLVRGNHVEHWLNGVKVVEYELGSEDWEERVRNSKFATMPRYGREPRGHIALQDHGDWVAFRNIKIRTF